jgi:hypothetical protein
MISRNKRKFCSRRRSIRMMVRTAISSAMKPLGKIKRNYSIWSRKGNNWRLKTGK